MTELVIPSPLAAMGKLYVTSGFYSGKLRPVYAIDPGAEGDITLKEDQTGNASIAWYQPQAGPYVTSPIVYNGYYYTLLDRGFLTCHDALTGKEVFGKKRFPRGGSFTASPWAYNGKLFCLNENGDTYVIEASGEFKVTRTNSLDELCLASPAIAQGRLLVRTASKLYCISR
jgi:outer membrane protein assembly factor BamB